MTTTPTRLSVWGEVLSESASDAEAQLDESCSCGVSLRDHYTTRNDWKECADVAGGEA